MKKFSQWFSNACISGLGVCLMALATAFANMQCSGRMYEPELPEKLRRE